MSNDIQIHWLPISQPFAGDYKFFPPPHDGDTIKMLDTIRMLSIDTPEMIGKWEEEDVLLEIIGFWMDYGNTSHFETAARNYVASLPETPHYEFKKKIDNAITRLLTRSLSDFPQPLRDYLRPRLSNQAATRHNQQADAARIAFEKFIFFELVPLKEQAKYMVNNEPIPLKDIPYEVFSRMAIIVTGEQRDFSNRVVAQRDGNGRILGYIAKSLSTEELQKKTRNERTTVNLKMLESGYATSFIIYPSLPTEEDLNRMVTAVANAIANKAGIWTNLSTILLPYEYRMCRKLIGNYNLETNILYRYCMDMTTKQVYEPWEYFKVQPQNRLFIMKKDKVKALETLSAAFTIRDNPLYGVNTHIKSNTLYGMWADTTTGNVYAVGECGTFYEWTKAEWQNGKPGTSCQVDTKVDFYDVFGFSQDDIWAVGTFGTVYHRDHGTWKKVTLPLPAGLSEPVWFEAVWGTGPNDLYIAGDECTIFHYNGTDWTEMAPPKTGQPRRKTHFYSIGGLPDSTLYAVGAYGRIMKLTPGKDPEWIKTPYTTNLNGIQILPGTNDFIVCGQKGVLFKLSGDKVHPLQEQLTDDFYAIDVKDKDTFLVVGRKGRAVYFHNNNWSIFSLGQNVYFEAVVYAGDDRFCGAGWFGRLMSFDSQSLEWYQHQSGAGDKIIAIAVNDQGMILAAAETGMLLYGSINNTQSLQTSYLSPMNVSEILITTTPNQFLLLSADGYAVTATIQGNNLALSNEFKYQYLNKGIQAKPSGRSGLLNFISTVSKSYGYDNYNIYDLEKPADSNTIKVSPEFPVKDESIYCLNYNSTSNIILVGGSRGSIIIIPNLDDITTWTVFPSGTYKPITAIQLNAGKLVVGFIDGYVRVIDIVNKSLTKAVSIGAPTYFCVQGTSKGFVFGGEYGTAGFLSFDSSGIPQVSLLQSSANQKDYLVSIEVNDSVFLAGVEQVAVYDAAGVQKQYYSLPGIMITAMAEYNGDLCCGTSSGEFYTGKISQLLNGTGVLQKDMTHAYSYGSPIVQIRKTATDLVVIMEDGSGYCNNTRIDSPGSSKYTLSSGSRDGSTGDVCFSGQARNSDGKYNGYFGFIQNGKFVDVSIPDSDLTAVTLHGEYDPGIYWAGGFSGSLLLYSKKCWFKVHTGIGNQLYSAAHKNGYVVITGKQGAIRYESSTYITSGINNII